MCSVGFINQLNEYILDKCSATYCRHLAFTDKRIGAGGEYGLLTDVQMAGEDKDQCGQAGRAKFFNSRVRLDWM